MPKINDFVSKIVKDPKKPHSTILLVGFLGKSSEKGHSRLYFDASLNNYVEIPNGGIIYKVKIPPAQSFLGASLVWIDPDAQLIYGRVGSTRVKASFLEGRIQQESMRAGQPLPSGSDALSTTIDPVWCAFFKSITTSTPPRCP